MKRDKDLIRALLLYVEEHASPYRAVSQPAYENFTTEEVAYNLKLLHQAGYIEGKLLPDSTWNIQSLTWQGHDFLDKARDETIWNAAKERVGGRFDKLSLDMLGKVLSEVAMQSLGLR